MRASLVAAALCLAWTQAGIAADDTEPSLSVMTQVIDNYDETDQVTIDAGRDEFAAQPGWVAAHRVALAVAREESRRPAFDESASVVFLRNAF